MLPPTLFNMCKNTLGIVTKMGFQGFNQGFNNHLRLKQTLSVKPKSLILCLAKEAMSNKGFWDLTPPLLPAICGPCTRGMCTALRGLARTTRRTSQKGALEKRGLYKSSLVRHLAKWSQESLSGNVISVNGIAPCVSHPVVH